MLVYLILYETADFNCGCAVSHFKLNWSFDHCQGYQTLQTPRFVAGSLNPSVWCTLVQVCLLGAVFILEYAGCPNALYFSLILFHIKELRPLATQKLRK